MAARNKAFLQTEETRNKIRTSQLINRLYGHAVGEIEMTPTQVRAAEVLLKKTLPDLTAAEITQDTTVRYVARLPDKAKSTEQWQQEHIPQPTPTMQ